MFRLLEDEAADILMVSAGVYRQQRGNRKLKTHLVRGGFGTTLVRALQQRGAPAPLPRRFSDCVLAGR